MADFIGSVGGAAQVRRQMYRDNNDGSHDETVAANLYVYDSANLEWVKMSLAEFRGFSHETTTIYEGETALTPKRAFANIAASQTDSSLVAAVASKSIRVTQLVMVAGATATNITFNTKPGGAGSAVSPLFANAANSGAVLPFNPVGWFQTSAGEGLTATTGAGSTTGVLIGYLEVS